MMRYQDLPLVVRHPVALLLLALGPACATARIPTIAFLPVETVGVPAEQGEALQAALLAEVQRTSAATPAPAERVAESLSTQPTEPPCRESDACLAKAGRAAASEAVVALTVAGIGDLWLVKGRLVRSEDGLALQEVQETAEGGLKAVESYAPQLAQRLFPDAGRKPWYRQWWLWTSVAAGVAAAGGIATWAALRDNGPASTAVVIGSL
ncbi:MAG: hypothetical protein HY901_35030 [Deltaproteobacteria bacterium]|nr:hypothetical protein [Deltaproteobacteria bacterium]